ncbi:hypothetical protein E2C01_030942 [Portunus trituberculatus]|uniref:Uncharacterized protein n=1 Tax=Portunus trituberculatus TaxID=210409 RepID=A0A5B7ET70_PORTR|nr:hypothetical protein [Portunus trituberculatus]
MYVSMLLGSVYFFLSFVNSRPYLARNTQNSLYSHTDYTWKFNKRVSIK